MAIGTSNGPFQRFAAFNESAYQPGFCLYIVQRFSRSDGGREAQAAKAVTNKKTHNNRCQISITESFQAVISLVYSTKQKIYPKLEFATMWRRSGKFAGNGVSLAGQGIYRLVV